MMRRRHFLATAISTLGLACLGVGPALARSLEEQVFSALRRQGYRNLSSNRTFLGRLRVTGTKGEKKREIILNRQTGEVLRDVIQGRGGYGSVFDSDDSDQSRESSGSSKRDDESDNSGPSNDDDRDDDRDNDDDRDSSGSGSGGDDD